MRYDNSLRLLPRSPHKRCKGATPTGVPGLDRSSSSFKLTELATASRAHWLPRESTTLTNSTTAGLKIRRLSPPSVETKETAFTEYVRSGLTSLLSLLAYSLNFPRRGSSAL